MNKFRGECEVTIGGEKRGLIFNMYAFSLMCDKLNIDLPEMGEYLDGKKEYMGTITLVWAGLETFCEVNGTKNKLTRPEVSEVFHLVDKKDQDKIKEAISYAFKSIAEKDTASNDKKK